jgi:hypothetical protein
MSNYISQYVPEQIKNMVSKLREATIDMGPQPVKYSKFSSITRASLLKMVPAEAIEIFSSFN